MGDEVLRNTLKVQRAMRDLTQAELAELAGVTRRSVNAIEKGHMVPSVILALKLARALGVSVDDIFRLDGRSGTAHPDLNEGVSHPEQARPDTTRASR